MHDLCIFLSFFVQKSFLTKIFFTFCWDKLDYPGSIVYLSCFVQFISLNSRFCLLNLKNDNSSWKNYWKSGVYHLGLGNDWYGHWRLFSKIEPYHSYTLICPNFTHYFKKTTLGEEISTGRKFCEFQLNWRK